MTRGLVTSSKYSPGNLTPEALQQLFVGRDVLLEEILDKIRTAATGDAKHYLVLIGARGMGKTHLLALVDHHLRTKSELVAIADRLRVAYLNEEEWGVASFLDFLRVILRALAAYHGAPDLLAKVQQVTSLFARNPDGARDLAERTLLDFIEDRTLLLLCENLADLMEGLGDEGQKRWRSLIQEHPFWEIVATTPNLSSAIKDHDSPFYGFFTVRQLDLLTVDEAIDLIRRKAMLEDRAELARFAQSPTGRARVRALHYLAGGNHRALITLAEFLTVESLDELSVPFLKMVDDLTPYYQERMKSLSGLQRKIVDYLSRQRLPVPVKQVAEECLVTPQSAAKQIGELVTAGFIRRNPQGRETYVELAEPLMRICVEVKDNRTKHIRLFVDLLKGWFTLKELTGRMQFLVGSDDTTRTVDRGHMMAALSELRPSGSTPFMDALKVELDRCVTEGDFHGAAEAAVRRAEELGLVEDYVRAAVSYASMRDIDSAMRWAGRGLGAHPKSARIGGVFVAMLLLRGEVDVAARGLKAGGAPAFSGVLLHCFLALRDSGHLDVAERTALTHPNDISLRDLRLLALSITGPDRYAEESRKALDDRPSELAFLAVASARRLAHKWDDVIEVAGRGLEAFPQSTWLGTEKVLALYELGRDEEALRIEVRDRMGRLTRVRALHRLGRAAEAHAELLHVLRHDDSLRGEEIEIYMWRVACEVALAVGDVLLAIEAVETLARKGVEHVDEITHVLMLIAAGRIDDALLLIEKGLLRSPTSVDLRVAQSICLLYGQRREEAETILSEQHGLSEANAALLANLAVLLEDSPVGEQVTEALVERLPEDADSWARRSLALLRRRKYDHASKALDRSLVLDPRHPWARGLRPAIAAGMLGFVDAMTPLRELVASTTNDGDLTLALRHLLVVELQEHDGKGLAQDTHAFREALGERAPRLLGWMIGMHVEICASLPSVPDEIIELVNRWSADYSDIEECKAPLRALSAVVQWKTTGDERPLLELPLEERRLIMDLRSGAVPRKRAVPLRP